MGSNSRRGAAMQVAAASASMGSNSRQGAAMKGDGAPVDLRKQRTTHQGPEAKLQSTTENADCLGFTNITATSVS